MNLLPVAARELRLMARQRRTYRSRMLSAVVVTVIALGMLYAGFGGFLSAASAGRNLFLALSFLGAAYVLADGTIMTADCLSQEHREGTLGLLFLTDLKGSDIIFGKLVSRMANSVYCLLAALPALGIGIFLGGVTGQDFCCMALALVNGLFLTAALGLFTSALSCGERRALHAALGGMFGLAIALPGLGWSWSAYFGTPSIPPGFLLLSPAGAFLKALAPNAPVLGGGCSFLSLLLAAHFLGWGFLCAASLVLPRIWSRESSLWHARRPGSNPQRTRRHVLLRGRRLDENPFLWLSSRPEDRSIWPFLLVFLFVWLSGCYALFGDLSNPLVYLAGAVVLHLGLVCFTSLQACRGPAEDRRSGVLEIVLTTPLGDEAYRRGRLLALKRRCFLPFLTVCTADVGLMAVGCWQRGVGNWEWLAWIGAWLVLIFKLLVDLYSVSWVGFWQGMKLGSTSRALRHTVVYVFLLRWFVLLGCLAAAGLLTEGRVFQSATGGVLAGGGYVILLAMSTLHFCAAAISDLQDNLRAIAIGADDAVSFRRFRCPKPKAPFTHEVRRVGLCKPAIGRNAEERNPA